jgi:hypothetical protein
VVGKGAEHSPSVRDIHKPTGIQVEAWKGVGPVQGKGDKGQMCPIGRRATGFEMKRYAASSHPSHIPKFSGKR